MSTQNPLLVLA